MNKKVSLIVATAVITATLGAGSSISVNAVTTESSNNRGEVVMSMFQSMIKDFDESDNNSYGLTDKSNGANEVNSDNSAYPNEYGGAYYSNDGYLNVNLTSYENKDYYTSILDDSYVKFHKVDTSLNDLLEIQKCIDDYDIVSSSVYQKSNTVEIQVTNENAIDEIENAVSSQGFDTDNLKFIVNDEYPSTLLSNDEDVNDNETTLKSPLTATVGYAYPGDRVYYWTGSTKGSSIATIGFNALNNSTNQYGYVTVEHALWNRSALGNSEIKMATVSQCTASKSVDACFVPFNNSNYQASGLINNSSLYGSTTYHITASYTANSHLEDYSLTRFGKTSGKSSVVVSTYCDYTLIGGDGTTIYNGLKMANNPASGGDSGGPIGLVQSDNSVILAGITSSSDSSYTYAPKISSILSTLNVSLVG